MDQIKCKWEQNKKWLYFSLLAAFVWGLAAHGYCFLNDSFNHDSLAEFNGAVFGNAFKIELGRFLVPIYRGIFRTDVTLPWLIGLLSLLWSGIAVFLVLHIFQIESKPLAFLIAGIFTVNITVTATAASYLHDFDCDLFGLMCAVAAVWLWKNVRWGSVLGAFFVTVPLAIYQCYISVTIVLAMFVCILALLNGEGFQCVLIKGLKAIGMLLLGGILYYVGLLVVSWITGIPLASGNVNSLDKTLELTPESIVLYTLQAYQDCYTRLVTMFSPYPEKVIRGSTLLLGSIVLVSAAVWVGKKQIHWPEKLLGVCLICLLPLGMNMTYILTLGEVHDLMMYAVWLFYLLALLLADWLVKEIKARWPELTRKVLPALPQWVCMALVSLLLYSNVQTANALYLKKDLECEAYLSLMTQIACDMDKTDGYIPGTTPVVFVGLSDQINSVRGMEEYSQIIGVWDSGPIILPERIYYQAYFDYILVRSAVMAGYGDWYALQKDSRASEMPAYPAEGAISMIDDILVVKLG